MSDMKSSEYIVIIWDKKDFSKVLWSTNLHILYVAINNYYVLYTLYKFVKVPKTFKDTVCLCKTIFAWRGL